MTGWIKVGYSYRALAVVAIFLYTKAVPVRRDEPWTVLLCKFSEPNYEIHSPDWFRLWFDGKTLDGSITKYFRDISNGMYNIHSANLLGWFHIPLTKRDVRLLAMADASLTDVENAERKIALKAKEICVKYALQKYGHSLTAKVITFVNTMKAAIFCPIRGILISPHFFMTAAVTHEIVHSLHIGHSFSDRQARVYPHAEPGEYDDSYDLMSTANAYSYRSFYGLTGPGLNGPHLDYLGWLPADRVHFFTFAKTQGIFHLSTLSLPHHMTKDWLLLLVPYDRDDPQKVFTVELRTAINYDRGLPSSRVLVHQIENRNGFYYSKLLRAQPSRYNTVRFLSKWRFVNPSIVGGAFIEIETTALHEHSAIVKISGNFTPTLCVEGEVQRKVFSQDDLVCVIREEQRLISSAFNEQPQRRDLHQNCADKLHEYKTMFNQTVCLNSKELATVTKQDRRWKHYQQFYNMQTYGLNMCKPGFVWRLIDAYDYVCVWPNRTAAEATSGKLWKSTLPIEQNCPSNLVLRNAFPGDMLCVDIDQQQLVQHENDLSETRLRYFKFFNGIDKIPYNKNTFLAKSYRLRQH
ncbi:hypothetical protein T4A_13223 [Trichinella pseudospiralis]|uniref:Uncharacterized protein n=1 Tax=Trichinella pseudospiralis TaxID=6337 RepID=A0A0V1ELE1_TRIPS|nr:hypothetical protein T4A_13223 [Trichinella pseudospiralis]